MDSFSVTHWIIMIVMILAFVVSPILGIVRGVKNGGVLNAVVSVLLPVYGLVYFVAARQPQK
jgi:ABC-type dipeptide/oligopeptide/nickel transport system permease component